MFEIVTQMDKWKLLPNENLVLSKLTFISKVQRAKVCDIFSNFLIKFHNKVNPFQDLCVEKFSTFYMEAELQYKILYLYLIKQYISDSDCRYSLNKW